MSSVNGPVQLTAFGEFLMRLHSAGSQRFLQTQEYKVWYAGAEANTCVLLSRLGVTTRYITRVPDNDLALSGIQQLQGHGVATNHILYGGEKLGLYFSEPGNHIRGTRVIYDRAGSSYAELQPGMIDWKKALHGTQYFHWSGVAAAVSQSAADVCGEALAVAKQNGLIISADFNYRSTLWKYGKKAASIMPALLQHSDIVVADLDSVALYYGITTDTDAPLETRFKQCAEKLQKQIPGLKTLAMSFRKTEGPVHIYTGALMHHGKYYFSAGCQLPFITDQIGSGDAFTGGMLYGIMNAYEPQSIIEFATACGALKQSIHGDWAIITKSEVEQFMQTGSSGRIIR
ncbi:sugar kinase [Niastella caeni]|uniref:Sugar kinase n=2 Tax=Niastella caeni TaxID=2569763 RepID=A0A4S8I1X1_9BACT|nr:sugar kinase [Niastella caeni]